MIYLILFIYFICGSYKEAALAVFFERVEGDSSRDDRKSPSTEFSHNDDEKMEYLIRDHDKMIVENESQESMAENTSDIENQGNKHEVIENQGNEQDVIENQGDKLPPRKKRSLCLFMSSLLFCLCA